MKTIGLTGGIGSGKSAVAGFLAGLGAVTVDLDKTGHEVLRQPEIKDRLTAEFGGDILNSQGDIDRSKMAKKIFHDRAALARLNAIVHPAIDAVVRDKVEAYRRRGEKVVVLEAAAMLEAGRGWQADEVWVTVSPEEAVLKRLAGRPGYTGVEVKARRNSQITSEARIKQADVVIENNGTLEELGERVAKEWRKLQERL